MKRLLVAVALLPLAACVVDGSSSGTSRPKPAPAQPTPPRPTGPVKLALFRATLAPGLPEGGFNLDRFNDSWRAQFAIEGGIDLASQDKTDKAQKDESKGRFNALTLGIDAVRVHVVVGTIKKAGFDPKTKKPVEVTLLTYTATVHWDESRRQDAYVEGSVFANEQMLKDLAGKVKKLVKG
jgi:hypothetical protein